MVCRINHRPNFAPVVKYASKSSKQAELVSTSLSAITPDGMIEEFEQLACRNTRCKNPCVHVVLSPAHGEQLTGEQWRQICERTAQELGMKQWVAFKHKDTGIEHVSLVGSRIGPDGRAWSTSDDRYRMRAVCRTFEQENGLRQTPEHSQHGIRINKTEIEKAERLCQTGKRPSAVPDRLAIAVAVRAALRQPTLKDFENCLTRQGITTRWRHDETGRPIGVSYGRGEACISGKHAGVSAHMLTVHYSDQGTTTHEQTCRATIEGRASTMAGASGRGDRRADPGRPTREHDGVGTDPEPAKGSDRGATVVFGADPAPIRQVGELMCRAMAGLQTMAFQMAEDEERFINRRQRQITPRRIPLKWKGISR